MLRPAVATENDVEHFSKVESTGWRFDYPSGFTSPWYEVVMGLPIPRMIPTPDIQYAEGVGQNWGGRRGQGSDLKRKGQVAVELQFRFWGQESTNRFEPRLRADLQPSRWRNPRSLRMGELAIRSRHMKA